ncbi:hypothetical protein [Nitrobacter hamburgensis]|uniref:hypothetical protein n=1 Tax=Nitrobacter hamburgensis TaxID=912 RepID=UPI00031132EA|nr:hypothetical protein [Nitrobacter hamburgensis]
MTRALPFSVAADATAGAIAGIIVSIDTAHGESECSCDASPTVKRHSSPRRGDLILREPHFQTGGAALVNLW